MFDEEKHNSFTFYPVTSLIDWALLVDRDLDREVLMKKYDWSRILKHTSCLVQVFISFLNTCIMFDIYHF